MTALSDRQPIAHRNLAVIETQDEETLDGLLRDPELRAHLWLRLDARRAVCDPTAVAQVSRVLAARGLPPRYARRVTP